ncbi:MAG TPA: hypothetical protein ENH84_04790 [Phycisphaerae bacterium]|nr:hypothetical protein [Phycisphaerae bacterium]
METIWYVFGFDLDNIALGEKHDSNQDVGVVADCHSAPGLVHRGVRKETNNEQAQRRESDFRAETLSQVRAGQGFCKVLQARSHDLQKMRQGKGIARLLQEDLGS